jgi:mannose-6-phosphate isomerase
MIRELDNTIQPYAWGSRQVLAELRGDAGPAPGPEAELWMGAHPLAPSRLRGGAQTLQTAIDAEPESLLGARVLDEYGQKLPFLLKVLAAATPLSLQAHPSATQAAAGYAADQAAGIALDAPHRNYKDPNHKPELICALSEFWALCGFRDVHTTLELLRELDVPALAELERTLAAEPNEVGISRAFSALNHATADAQHTWAEQTTRACQARSAQSQRFADELSWAARVGELYPGDVGVVSSLLLNLVRLEPDDAIYLPAGNLHAYLGGTGVEIMASSDNVLRGGLTPKHVNVPELLRILDFRPLAVEVLKPIAHGLERVYAAPAREFRLSYFDLTESSCTVRVEGPEIWLVTSGSFELKSATSTPLSLKRGSSAFVAASTGQLTLRGNGRIFRASVAH